MTSGKLQRKNRSRVFFEHSRQFRTWATTMLDPAARERQITSCAMCQQHLDTLPDYSFKYPYQHAQHHARQHPDAGARKEEDAHEEQLHLG